MKMETQHIIIIAIIGIAAGVLSGMLGLGSAIIIIPALVMTLGFSQQLAQGTTLMMMVLPIGALAAFQYYQQGLVDFKVAMIMAFFFFIGGYFGAKFATQLPQEILKKSFAFMMIVIALKMLFFTKIQN